MRQPIRNLLWVVLGFICVAPLAHGLTVGLEMTKTCPTGPVLPGASFQCTFTVRNADPENFVINLAVTSTVPCIAGPPNPCGPGSGPPVSVPCQQDGVTVTTLAPFGSPRGLDTCGGTIDETAPNCSGTDFVLADGIAATGTDADNCSTCSGTPVPVEASVTNEVLICCRRTTCLMNSTIVLIWREIVIIPVEGPIFLAPGVRNAMLSMLDTVMRKVNDLRFDEASQVLRNLRKNLDGCASADGTPARNDWIQDCGVQTRIRSLIDELLAELAAI